MSGRCRSVYGDERMRGSWWCRTSREDLKAERVKTTTDTVLTHHQLYSSLTPAPPSSSLLNCIIRMETLAFVLTYHFVTSFLDQDPGWNLISHYLSTSSFISILQGCLMHLQSWPISHCKLSSEESPNQYTITTGPLPPRIP